MNPNSDPDKTPRPASGSKKAKPFFPPGSTGLNSTRLRAELQHEEAKLRIFKIFIALFVLCAGAFLAMLAISLFGLRFSSIWLIICGAVCGIAARLAAGKEGKAE